MIKVPLCSDTQLFQRKGAVLLNRTAAFVLQLELYGRFPLFACAAIIMS